MPTISTSRAAAENKHPSQPHSSASSPPPAHPVTAKQGIRQTQNAEISFPTLLSHATSLLQICTAYAFFLSVMHMVTFFKTIKLNPLYIPLTFTDYVVNFCAWVDPVIYLSIVVILTLVTIKAKQSARLRKTKIILYIFTGCVIHAMTIQILPAVGLFGTIHLFVMAIIIFICFQLPGIYDFSKDFTLSTIAMLIVATFSICLYFSSDVEETMNEAMQNKQAFTHGSTTIEGYYLRAFERGILVRTCAEKKSTLFFLPHNNDEKLLQFPSSLTCPSPEGKK